MKFLKIFLIVVILILAGFSIWNVTLPGRYDVHQSTTINAPAERIFSHVNDVEKWVQWSPWAEMDNTAEFTYGEQTVGAGAFYSWTGDTLGKGQLTIVESVPNSKIKTKLEFTEPNMSTSTGYWKFEEENGQTKVTWGNTGELPFFMRFIRSMLESQLNKDFAKGLNNIKTLVEEDMSANSGTVFQNGQIDIVQIEGGTYVGKRYTDLPWSEMEDAYSTGYANIYDVLGMEAKNITGAPFGQFITWDEESETTSMIVGIPVETDIKINDPLEKGQLYSGKVVRYAHYGPYEKTGEGHLAVEKYFLDNDLTYNGNPWESYVTDPGAEPDSSKWLTLIYYPVQ
jgi:effector-binding domain-containing protein/uncharacterized protein YndB with AHSA1/START domain